MLIMVTEIGLFFFSTCIAYLSRAQNSKTMAKAKYKASETPYPRANEAIEPYTARFSDQMVIYKSITAYSKLLHHSINNLSLGKHAVVMLLTLFYAAKPMSMANIDKEVSDRECAHTNAYLTLNKLIKLGHVLPSTGRKSKWGGMGYRYSLTISGRLFVENNLVAPLIAAIQ